MVFATVVGVVLFSLTTRARHPRWQGCVTLGDSGASSGGPECGLQEDIFPLRERVRVLFGNDLFCAPCRVLYLPMKPAFICALACFGVWRFRRCILALCLCAWGQCSAPNRYFIHLLLAVMFFFRNFVRELKGAPLGMCLLWLSV